MVQFGFGSRVVGKQFSENLFFLTIRIGSVAEPEPIKFLFYFLFLFEPEAEAIFWIGSVSFFLASEKLYD